MNFLDLGDVTITRVVDWAGPVATVDVVFPGLDRAQWEANRELVAPDFWNPDTNAYELALQSWVIRSGGRTIVVDTSVGHQRDRPNMPDFNQMNSDYPAALRNAGVETEDVDLVVNTHLHLDHVGWNTRWDNGDWVPTFPNATYLFPQPDLDYWHPDAMSQPVNARVNVNVWEDSIKPIIQAGLSKAWDGAYRIDDNLSLDLAPGHTPGSSILTVTSGGATAVLVGDVFHSPIQIAEPCVNSCFCEDADQAAKTRARVLSWAAESNALILPGHLPAHGAFEVARDADRYSLTRWGPFESVRPGDGSSA